MGKKALVTLMGLLVVVASIGLVYINRYNITDYIILRGYNPPTEISALANDNTFNELSKKLFYVNKPQVLDRSSFSDKCKETEQTIVLGCYTGVNIYIFKVDDPKLEGVEQVTAAHEMLHVAYGRLSPSERKRIDKLVETSYKKINDPRITALADSYDKQQPGSVPNELHSILATEVNDIDPELEAYYSRYFNDRSKVVAYANNYQKVFDDINLQVKKYDGDLALRKAEIERRESDLKNQSKQLQIQKNSIDTLLSSGQARQYNAQATYYNQAVNDYNNEVAEVQKLVDEYNRLVVIRNNLNLQQQDLAKSIDSRPSTITNE
jgi:thiol-disulfide isomerase/thioredoxin